MRFLRNFIIPNTSIMKHKILIIFSLILCFSINEILAQKVILLQKMGSTKRYFYEIGDKISVHLGDPEFVVYGTITYIDDSVCTVNKDYTFELSKVHEVWRTRHFLKASWAKFMLASVLYAGGSMINHALHDEKPLIDNTVPIVSGSFIALGTTAYLLRYKKCRMEDNWQIKVLDFEIFKERYGEKE